VSVFLIYSLLALRDLLRHGWTWSGRFRRRSVRRTNRNLEAGGTRHQTSWMAPACTRAAIESLSESLTDGFVSPVFWYALGGLPGLIIFKVVSTMDSMVGYKTERYLRFGWCGARADDLMNWLRLASPGCC